MAREMYAASAPGNTVYFRVKKNGQWWNGAAMENYDAGSYADYAVAGTEEGASGVFYADFPTGIVAGGTYEYYAHLRVGVAPAEGDPIVSVGRVDWTGSASIAASLGAMSGEEFRDYIVEDKGFARDDKDQQIYAAITDAIQILRRRFPFDEAKAETTSTDQIEALGQFKIDLEDDLGLLLDVTLEDGTLGTPLIRKSRSQFNTLYPGINVDDWRGYPKHYCVFAGQIQIGPIPDSLAYSYRIGYSRSAGIVTSATAGVPFTNRYRDILADKVLELLWAGLEENDKADRHRALCDVELEHAISRERKNAGEGSFNQRPTNF